MLQEEATRDDARRAALLILRVLEDQGPMDGYNVARVIAQASAKRFVTNSGTVHPLICRLEADGHIAFEWRRSAANRLVKWCSITDLGRDHLQRETTVWLDRVAAAKQSFCANEFPGDQGGTPRHAVTASSGNEEA